jgi:WD40 repeat protein
LRNGPGLRELFGGGSGRRCFRREAGDPGPAADLLAAAEGPIDDDSGSPPASRTGCARSTREGCLKTPHAATSSRRAKQLTQTDQLAAQFTGHTDDIRAIAFSPDGRRLVSGGEDRVVRVWDVGTGECQAELRGHTDAVFAAAFLPGGTRLATAGRDWAVWLWDLAKGEEVARLTEHVIYVWSLAFSTDGKTLASGSGDNTVHLWDTEPLRLRHEACREAEALQPEAERLVAQLFAQLGEPPRLSPG